MGTRNILDVNGIVVGKLTLPDSTSESEWQEKLASYVVDPSLIQTQNIFFDIQARKRFAEEMIERFKKENIKAGINALQAIHMHTKIRALTGTFMGYPYTVDIINLVVAGDLEVAILCLLYCDNLDDGTMPYHWFTAGRRDSIVAELKAYLGWA